MTELTEALAEVDGLLAGINYVEKVEPNSEETTSSFCFDRNLQQLFQFKTSDSLLVRPSGCGPTAIRRLQLRRFVED